MLFFVVLKSCLYNGSGKLQSNWFICVKTCIYCKAAAHTTWTWTLNRLRLVSVWGWVFFLFFCMGLFYFPDCRGQNQELVLASPSNTFNITWSSVPNNENEEMEPSPFDIVQIKLFSWHCPQLIHTGLHLGAFSLWENYEKHYKVFQSSPYLGDYSMHASTMSAAPS